MRENVEYALAWTTLKFLGALPRSSARSVGAQLAALLFRLQPRWRQIALFNLQLAFPESTDAERQKIVSNMVRNLGWLAAEFAHLPHYNRQNIEDVIVLDGFENFAAAERQGKGVLFLTGHMGAWELKPFAHALYQRPIYFVVRPINNPRVDRLVNRYRSLSGNQPIEKKQAARAILKALHHGGVVGILADQNAALEDSVFVDFLGIPAATTTGIARMARHSGAPVVPVYSFWDPALGKYRLRYEPALTLTRTDDEERDIRDYVVQFNQALSSYVRRFPDQWFWVHRRWKTRPLGEQPIYPDLGVGISAGAPPQPRQTATVSNKR
jgi:Kdo2-lipid IVA lauroyltransferase/acyltransferase